MEKTGQRLKLLKEKYAELTIISSTLSVLNWDEQVMMPHKSASYRAKMIGYLSGLIHRKILELNEKNLLESLNALLDKFNADDQANIKECNRLYQRTKNVPQELVEKISEITSEAHMVWMKAREENDYSLFEPILERIVDLKIEEANYIGYKKSPYDAMLDDFERDITSDELTVIFNKLKDFLIPFLAKIKNSQVKINRLEGNFSISKQQLFNRMLAEKIGFDFKAGRLDSSAHPFTDGFNPKDVRITTRYDRNDLFQSVMSTIHETGHALYEQGLPEKFYGTPRGEAVSFGIHESQSLMWEKRIGRSLPFWQHFYPILQKNFPKALQDISPEEFYNKVNIVEPSLIRTDADEVTYCLHIILRFELEKDLIEQKIRVCDLPRLWNEKFEKYLGIMVPNDTQGVLQDIHWSSGGFGYFPSYALGNLYSAQISNSLRKDISNIDDLIKSGNLAPILGWLKENIFQYGKLYTPKVLLKKVTGSELDPGFFFDYLTEKYSAIYKLNA